MTIYSRWPLIQGDRQGRIDSGLGFGVNATSNNISVISWQSILLVEETGVPRETTDLPQVPNKLYHITMYWVHLVWAGFELTTLVVIGTHCNYNTITTTMAPAGLTILQQISISHETRWIPTNLHKSNFNLSFTLWQLFYILLLCTCYLFYVKSDDFLTDLTS